jgi:hypothetical protein
MTCHQSRIGYGKPWAPSRSTTSRGRLGSAGSTSCENPRSKETRSLDTPSSSHDLRTRASSSGSGVTATCSVPAAAKTIVLAPDPVSSVAIPGRSSPSSHSSAGHARPQYSSPEPWIPGGASRSRSVSVGAIARTLLPELRVDGVVGTRRGFPGELGGARDPLGGPLGRAGENLFDGRGHVLGRSRVEQARSLSAHLRK